MIRYRGANRSGVTAIKKMVHYSQFPGEAGSPRRGGPLREAPGSVRRQEEEGERRPLRLDGGFGRKELERRGSRFRIAGLNPFSWIESFWLTPGDRGSLWYLTLG